MNYQELKIQLTEVNFLIMKEEKKLKLQAKKEVKALIKEFGIKRNQVFNAKGKAIKAKEKK